MPSRSSKVLPKWGQDGLVSVMIFGASRQRVLGLHSTHVVEM